MVTGTSGTTQGWRQRRSLPVCGQPVCAVPERDAPFHDDPAGTAGTYGAVPTQGRGPGGHIAQAVAGALRGGRSDAVVGDGQDQLRPGRDGYLDGGRLCVPQHIGQRLAQDGHHLVGYGGRDQGVHGAFEVHSRRETDLGAGLRGKCRDLRAQCGWDDFGPAGGEGEGC